MNFPLGWDHKIKYINANSRKRDGEKRMDKHMSANKCWFIFSYYISFSVWFDIGSENGIVFISFMLNV